MRRSSICPGCRLQPQAAWGVCACAAPAPGLWVMPGERMGRQTVRRFVPTGGQCGRHLHRGRRGAQLAVWRLLRRGASQPLCVWCVRSARGEALLLGAPGGRVRAEGRAGGAGASAACTVRVPLADPDSLPSASPRWCVRLLGS